MYLKSITMGKHYSPCSESLLEAFSDHFFSHCFEGTAVATAMKAMAVVISANISTYK